MLGVPGTGKSAFAKALGSETGRPTLILDIGSLMGSLVGSTEANIRQALKIIDAMEPCICFIDEVEKVFNLKAGDTTKDGKLSLETARCIGACGLAPAVTVDEVILAKQNPGDLVKSLKATLGVGA